MYLYNKNNQSSTISYKKSGKRSSANNRNSNVKVLASKRKSKKNKKHLTQNNIEFLKSLGLKVKRK